MKITPITNKTSIYNYNSHQKNAIMQTKYFDSLSFKGLSIKESMKKDVQLVSNSSKYKSEITRLRQESLAKGLSLKEFLSSAMNIVSSHCSTYHIKEDFFEYKAKNRFVDIVIGCLDGKFEDTENPSKLDDYLQANYWWGLTNSKFGSSFAFSVAAICILPYARGYEKELQLLKLKGLETQENNIRNSLQKQEKALRVKEFISDNYLQLVAVSKNDSTVTLPNAIMLEGKKQKETQEFIGWTLSKTMSNKIVVENDSNSNNALIKNRLKSALEKSKKTFEDYRIPTLIYCENFDKLLYSSNSASEIASIKALLSSTYSKYGATIIFSTKNANRIDNVIKQPHRMKSINIDKED